MRVYIKSLNVEMEVKKTGIEFEVRSADNKKQLGDVYLSQVGLIWCKGKTTKRNGKLLSWDEFVEMMETH